MLSSSQKPGRKIYTRGSPQVHLMINGCEEKPRDPGWHMYELNWYQTQLTFDAALGLSTGWNTVHEYNLGTHMKELNSSCFWGYIRSRSPGHQNLKMFLKNSLQSSLPFTHALTIHALIILFASILARLLQTINKLLWRSLWSSKPNRFSCHTL